MKRPAWQQHRNCTPNDLELFFSDDPSAQRAAKRLCAACPVSSECLSWAISHNEWDGIWGGMTYRERVRYLRTLVRRRDEERRVRLRERRAG